MSFPVLPVCLNDSKEVLFFDEPGYGQKVRSWEIEFSAPGSLLPARHRRPQGIVGIVYHIVAEKNLLRRNS
jgi:hypothetical protein